MSNSFDGVHTDNLEIDGYIVQESIGQGCIGKVCKCYNQELEDTRAVKFIPKEVIDKKPNWRNEIIKANKLHSVNNVVSFKGYGYVPIDGKDYLYIMWDYVNGKSLKSIIKDHELTVQMLLDVVECSLTVFFACKSIGMQHADFHSGNVIIEDENPLSINRNERKVWITDFGYGTFSQVNAAPPMDDYMGLSRIIQEGIESIDFHSLIEEEDRIKYDVLKNKFPRYLHETNPTEGNYVRNPSGLLNELKRLCLPQVDTQDYQKNIGDYLAAEFIGEQYSEWNALFVPKFLAADSLFDKNTCVLTGLRGCGKTMIFKRLSFELQAQLGPAGIPGESDFIGFYLNARVLAEAFPWLPVEKRKDARNQIINFFNAKWCIEILNWLRYETRSDRNADVSWLPAYFSSYFQDCSFTSSTTDGIIESVLERLKDQLIKSKLGEYYSSKDRPLSGYSVLFDFLSEINKHHNYGKGKSVFFFLDDYSAPMIDQTMQEILNPVIFRRMPNVFFKVSTESTESFIPKGLNGKILENGADYKLVDLGSELLKSNNDSERIKDIILAIFEKRIQRSSVFSNHNINLDQLLGPTDLNNNKLAQCIHEDKTSEYYGVDTFCNLWSSDIRELIKILSEMVSSEGNEKIQNSLQHNTFDTPIIDRETQNRVLKDTGGHYLASLNTTTNPNRTIPNGSPDETYGKHLVDITTAFQEIAYFDLKTKTSKNQEQNPPKQARKIEITSFTGSWRDNAEDYYKGLIRYGVFIQDYRAKSVRGTAAQRLYLRSILIPYCRLTFSRRDSITMDWDDFNDFLLEPRQFLKKYKNKSETDVTQYVLDGFEQNGDQ